MAADDTEAKAAVIAIIERLGFQPRDAGGLANARFLEPIAAQNIQFAYALGLGMQITPVWITRG